MRHIVSFAVVSALLIGLCAHSASSQIGDECAVQGFTQATLGDMEVLAPYTRYVLPLKLKKQTCVIAAFALDRQTRQTVNVDAVLCDKKGKPIGANYDTFFPVLKVTPPKADSYCLVITNSSFRPIIVTTKIN